MSGHGDAKAAGFCVAYGDIGRSSDATETDLWDSLRSSDTLVFLRLDECKFLKSGESIDTLGALSSEEE